MIHTTKTSLSVILYTSDMWKWWKRASDRVVHAWLPC